ncbi:MAG TPA: phosphopantetheine-binding protein [Actinomycetota bacterium]|nr:phosphopantetheine-binding protein [Actinomycetota bacterium]
MKEPVSSVKPAIHSFVDRFFGDAGLGDDDDMFATGYVNSMFALQLVQFVEGEFGVTVDSDDLDLDNFRTVSAIAEFVERKQAASSVAG